MTFFSQIYDSYKYQKTFLPPVALDDQWAEKHLATEELAQKVKQLFLDEAARKAFCDPFEYNLEIIQKRNQALTNKGFTLLSTKPYNIGETSYTIPYSVAEHPDLEGYVLKSGAARVKKGEILEALDNDLAETCFFTQEDSLLRLEVAERIRELAKEVGIEVVVPEKKLVCLDPKEKDPTKKYCILSKKIEVLTKEETIEKIRGLGEQAARELAEKICSIVERVGFVDATFSNIRMTPDDKIAFIDTEPLGLIVAQKKQHFWKKIITFFSGDFQSSVEKCGRVGLYQLKVDSAAATTNLGQGLVVNDGIYRFAVAVQEKYQTACKFKVSQEREKQPRYISVMMKVADFARALFREKVLQFYAVVSAFFGLIGNKSKEQYFTKIFSFYLSEIPYKPGSD